MRFLATTAASWTTIGILGAFMVALLTMTWQKMDRLAARIDAQTARIDAQTERIDGLRVELKEEIAGQTARIDAQTERIDRLTVDVGQLRADFGELRGELRGHAHDSYTHQVTV